MIGLWQNEDEGSEITQNVCTYLPIDISCISLNWIFSNAAVRTWNLSSQLLATIV